MYGICPVCTQRIELEDYERAVVTKPHFSQDGVLCEGSGERPVSEVEVPD